MCADFVVSTMSIQGPVRSMLHPRNAIDTPEIEPLPLYTPAPSPPRCQDADAASIASDVPTYLTYDTPMSSSTRIEQDNEYRHILSRVDRHLLGEMSQTTRLVRHGLDTTLHSLTNSLADRWLKTPFQRPLEACKLPLFILYSYSHSPHCSSWIRLFT